jgi:hypothetical protein
MARVPGVPPGALFLPLPDYLTIFPQKCALLDKRRPMLIFAITFENGKINANYSQNIPGALDPLKVKDFYGTTKNVPDHVTLRDALSWSVTLRPHPITLP